MADTLEILFGGAARGGKSDALLMAAAQYVSVPGYAALLLRSSFPDLMQADALIPRSKEWWNGTTAKWTAQERRWTFPSGATITFGYLERDDDVYQYQGAAFQFIAIDELTQHNEWPYRYLFSRLTRRTGVEVPLRMRASANPGGKGHEWVKKRFITQPQDGRLFVPSKIEDNPSTDRTAYEASAVNLDPITRAQLLAGDWNAHTGGRFRREWFRYYQNSGDGIRLAGQHIGPLQLTNRFLTVDPAATAPKTAKDDPDYTVISAWCLSPTYQLIWLDCMRIRVDVPDIPQRVLEMYRRWKCSKAAIESVAANNAVYQLCQRLPMNVVPLLTLGQDKLVRATEALNLAEAGRLYLPETAPWREEAEAELVRFTGDPKKDGHDDIVDTVSYAAKLHRAIEEEGIDSFTPYIFQS